jgi:DNA-binding NarL/FixJ family response regulator
MTDQIRCWIVGPYQLYNQALIYLFDRLPGFIGVGQTMKLIFWDDLPKNQPFDVILFNFFDFEYLESILANETSHTFVWIAHDWTLNHVQKALKLGVTGCIDAKSPEDEFLSIIRQVVKGEIALSSQLAVNLYLSMVEEEKGKERIALQCITIWQTFTAK